jgi:hypothetical protein
MAMIKRTPELERWARRVKASPELMTEHMDDLLVYLAEQDAKSWLRKIWDRLYAAI